MTNDITTVLVVGATGKTGSRVLERLKIMPPPSMVKAGGRDSEVIFDWHRSDTWAPALDNISHVYLTYYPDLAVPASIEHIRAFCQLAKSAGVAHITLLSGRGEPVAQQCEEILMASGLSWNVVRASWFNQNFSEGFFKSFIDYGQINLPVSTISEPFIDIDDIAEVAAKTIVDKSLANRLFEVTGPELLTFDDIASQFSSVLKRDIRFNSVTEEDFRDTMSKSGVPDDVLALMIFLFTEVLDGRNEYVTDGVREALGRPATSFARYLEKNKKVFEL